MNAQYETIGRAYDVVGGLDLYHRVFWGVRTREYRAFAEAAAAVCGDGALLDAGCGSMLFTAPAHRTNARGAVIGIDASLRMLRLARSRVGSDADARAVALVKADVLRSPFPAGAFGAVVCMHVAHVLEDLSGLLSETQRMLEPGGTLFLTSVVLADRWRDRYLRALSRRGIMATPRRPDDVVAAVRARFGTEPDCRMVGNMLFVQVTHLPR
jgi:ubiquinone/menaquinone biosynthesis C-methylase UbiE